MIDHLKQHYGYIFEDELLEEIQRVAVVKQVKEGDKLIEIGNYITAMPLLLSGAVKIIREDKDGYELVLYFIEKGDTCAMTLSCCMGQKKSEIRAIAETDTELLMIPVEKMGLWMSTYKSWQNFILQSYHERMTELLEAIDTIAFLKMDERLFKYLKDKAMINHNHIVQVTHQQIANDMHTSRVVISRLLKALENEKKIQLHRNAITILEL